MMTRDTGRLTLSAAMLAGARLHPQAFGQFIVRDGAGTILATCANGAAVRGAIAHDPRVVGRTLAEVFPLLAVAPPRPLPCGCPARGGRGRTIAGLIDHLNDEHRWPREAIAAWVARVERCRAGQEKRAAPAYHIGTERKDTYPYGHPGTGAEQQDKYGDGRARAHPALRRLVARAR